MAPNSQHGQFCRTFTCVIFLILLLALLPYLCSCVTQEEAPPPPQEPVADLTEPESPAARQQDEPPSAEWPQLDIPLPVLEMQLSEEPERYKPTPTITPLVNSVSIYRNCLIGDIIFIRAADQSRVELPFAIEGYNPVRAGEDGAVIAYALFDRDYRIAFMSVEGEMLTDFVYSGFGEDSCIFPNRYGYVTVMRYNDNWDALCGLLDLRNGKEVIPLEYDDPYSFQPLKYAILASKNENFLLLDYSGKILFEFGKEPYISYDDKSHNSYYSFYASEYFSKYTFLQDSGEIFSHGRLAEGDTVCFYGGMTITFSDYRTGAAVYNQWGEQVYSDSGFSKDFVSGGALLLLTFGNAKIDIIRPSGGIQIEIPEAAKTNGSYGNYLTYGSELVTLTYEDDNDSALEHSVTYDLQGLKVAESSAYSYDSSGHIRYRFVPEYSQQLEDGLGNIIIPFGSYGNIYTFGPFIIGESAAWDSPDFDILNAQGQVLLHNPFGAITWENGFDDRMVVWPDEKTCIFLYPDGSTEPISDPPKVERVFIGG